MAAFSFARKLDAHPSGWRGDLLRIAVAMLLAAVIMVLTITEAKRRDMHHTVMISIGEQIALSIALSETVYGLNLGYIGFTSVLNAVHAHWNKDADGWSKLPKLIENFHSADALNDGIKAGASLGPQKPGYFTDGSLMTTIYDDMGEIDFYKLAFALYGLKIQSAFKTYYLLICLSALTFILTFRRNVFALGTLLCMLFAFYIELNLPVFDQVGNPTVFGMRHSSTLGLVPMLFFAFLLMFPRRLSAVLLAGAVLQLFILILAWRIRSSVAWMFIFMVGLAVALAVLRSWTVRPGQSWWPALMQGSIGTLRSWPLLLRDSLRWPLVLLLAGIVANAAYNSQSRHLIYSTDDVIPYHGLWWTGVNAFYDKQPQVFAPRVKNTGDIPEGWWHLRDYLDRIHLVPWTGNYTTSEPVPGLISPWTRSQVRYRLVDEAMRRIFMEALAKDPLVSAHVYLIDQPLWMFTQLVGAFTKQLAWIPLTLVAGLGVFAFVLLLRNGEAPDAQRKALVLTGAAVVTSFLPNLWANASWPSMPDTILLTSCFMSLGLGCGAYWLFERWRLKQPTALSPAE